MERVKPIDFRDATVTRGGFAITYGPIRQANGSWFYAYRHKGFETGQCVDAAGRMGGLNIHKLDLMPGPAPDPRVAREAIAQAKQLTQDKM